MGDALLQLCVCVRMRVESKRCADSVVGVRECEERSPNLKGGRLLQVSSVREEGKGHGRGLALGDGVSMAVFG